MLGYILTMPVAMRCEELLGRAVDSMSPTNERIAGLILQLLNQRACLASICPSEAARCLASDETQWRRLMPQVRAVAATLQDAGIIRITRGDAAVTRATLENGPIRLRRSAR